MKSSLSILATALLHMSMFGCNQPKYVTDVVDRDASPPHASPIVAIGALIYAYNDGDLDRVFLNRDFDVDSKLFWQDLGLPLSADIRQQSAQSFESNLKIELEKKPRDYSDWRFEILSEELVQKDFAVVILRPSTPTADYEPLRIPVVLTDKGWKVVIHPQFDVI